MKRVTKKRNYRAERKSAQDFADALMEGHRLPQKEWLQMWGVIYEARLAQIRTALGEPDGQ